MSAAELRQAAETLRWFANSLPDSPWMVQKPWLHEVKDADGRAILSSINARHDIPAYVATMHPGVGLALADWLEATATESDRELSLLERAYGQAAPDFQREISPLGTSLARLINGGAS